MPNEDIMHIDKYIKKISQIIKSRNDENSIIVYRGENRNFPTCCIPNIYREGYLKNYEFFEKNIFDEMRANKIAKGDSYLENAICAQHDGFPSRLLDVTYNSLVALYFACTPYYRYDAGKYDEFDGKVFVFFIDQVFCPTGENTTENYHNLITDKNSFINKAVFSKNHKLIDHIKINNRIIAQQGAFILFQGDEAEPIQKYMYEELVIPKGSKEVLRKELKELFGIYTGSIYPEAENLIDEIKRKSLNIENSQFDINSELAVLLYNLECEIRYYLSEIFKGGSDKKEKVKRFEKLLRSYHLGISEINETSKLTSKFIQQYNDLITGAFEDIELFFGKEIETSKDYLTIKDVEDDKKKETKAD